jgi:RNA ligase
MSHLLLTRNAFREGVFSRDRNLCVNCGNPGKDAHHLLERRLFRDGGYYLNNGVTLCAACHLEAEKTLLSVERLREAAGITVAVLPSHFYPEQAYDKWGNPIVGNDFLRGQRLRGELFHEEPVQKILAPLLHMFTNRVKYPRTYHLPSSPGATDDDKILDPSVIAGWAGEDVVVLEKMDGENTNMYSDYLHARSLDYSPHPSRSWVRALHGQIRHDIPDDWRICGENLAAAHSIHYTDLPSYFLVFSIWDEGNMCLSWADTQEWTTLLGLQTVPVLYRGKFADFKAPDLGGREGYVVRPQRAFHFQEFSSVVGKWVRPNHVQTDQHWMQKTVEFNGLRHGS